MFGKILVGLLVLSFLMIVSDYDTFGNDVNYGPMPLLLLKSISVSHLSYSRLPTPFFTTIIIAHLSLHNSNPIRFVYHNSNVSLLGVPILVMSY